jgi:hypothetical protein
MTLGDAATSAMAHCDVFNGDADGICALHQLRLAAPMPATLVTGPKHDVDFIAAEPLVRALIDGREADLEMARQCRPHAVLPCGALYVLVSDAAGGYAVSVRSPLGAPRHSSFAAACATTSGSPQ